VQLYGQVIGCGKDSWLQILTDLQKELIKQGSRQNALIIHSEFFEDASKLDELSVCSKSQIIELAANHQQIFDFDPRDLGLELGLKAEIETGKDHQVNAEIIKELLNAQSSKLTTAVHTASLNAAAILYLANKEQSLSYDQFLDKLNRYYKLSLETITSGKALDNLNNLIKLYRRV
jgi:anthranilate phosphoribosyltransferase